jgi:hypothetical protein
MDGSDEIEPQSGDSTFLQNVLTHFRTKLHGVTAYNIHRRENLLKLGRLHPVACITSGTGVSV